MAELSTLARPYAKAAFEHAVASNELAAWSAQLGLAAAVSQAPNIQSVLGSPSLTTSQQADKFISVCGDDLSAQAQNFVKVLAENKRLALLPQIAALYDEFKANREKSVDVEVSTAFDLDEALQSQLAQALTKQLDREVNLQSVVDKSLLGGVLIRAADVVIDGSVRGRLNKLAETMGS